MFETHQTVNIVPGSTLRVWALILALAVGSNDHSLLH